MATSKKSKKSKKSPKPKQAKGEPRELKSGDVATNRRARHKFELVEKFEAGVELRGSEVKSLRDGKAQINEAFATINEGE
ncbi:MAG: SsrA-binding protein, partial [bacterium]